MEKITGILGFKGEPGVSPTIEVSKVNKTTTLTITDVEGTKTATILDGEDGETTNIIDNSTLLDNEKQTYSGKVIDSKITDINTNITAIDNSKQNNILSGTTAPTSDLGEDGDIYFQYTE